MSHGSFKPRNQHLHEVLMSRKSGTHEAKAGKHAKRAKANRQMERELRNASEE